jgi:hypothetical protein
MTVNKHPEQELARKIPNFTTQSKATIGHLTTSRVWILTIATNYKKSRLDRQKFFS